MAEGGQPGRPAAGGAAGEVRGEVRGGVRGRAFRQELADATAMAALVAVARDLGDATDEATVLQVITDRATPLLGAQAMGLALLEPGGRQVRTMATAFDAAFLAEVAHLPVTLRLPLVDTAVTGTAHFLPDLPTTADAFPDTPAVYARTGTQASAAVPLTAGGQLLGALSVAHDHPHTWRTAERELLETLAALTTQALQRLTAQDAERAAALAAIGLSEALQRSLLTRPRHPGDLDVAARYLPAAARAHVGGDWYDTFPTTRRRRTDSGTGTSAGIADAGGIETVTNLIIGDVTGHDTRAAAAMAQLRNLLRGVAHATGGTPANVLAGLDRAVADLGVDAYASVLHAQLDQHAQLDHLASPPAATTAARARVGGADESADGPDGHTRVLRWSNAGHPPPLLICPDGSASYLQAPSDLLLGVLPDVVRHDHTTFLSAGATVLLYTDGLVERRGQHLRQGLHWLVTTATQLGTTNPHQLCDALLDRIGTVEDDVALLAVHLRAP